MATLAEDHILVAVTRYEDGLYEATCSCTWESMVGREHKDALVADHDQHVATELRNERRQLESHRAALRPKQKPRRAEDADRQRRKREDDLALQVECPKCGAGPGRCCQRVQQYGAAQSPLRHPHGERRVAAARRFAGCPRCHAQPGQGCEFKAHNWNRDVGKPLKRLHRERIDNLAAAPQHSREGS